MDRFTTIAFTRDGAVATLTLNRPDKRNPIGPVTCGELRAALAEIAADATLRVVILTGAGAVFSAGGDLASMGAPPAGGVPPASLVDLLLDLHRLGKPIIARVQGHALAGGLGLMVACDLVIASSAAQFGTTEIQVGLWPMMITAELVRNIGRKRTLEMMLTGRKLAADEALAIGLVTEVVAPDALDARVATLAAELAAKSPAAMALGLRAFYATQDAAFEPGLRTLEAELGRVLALDDAREGIAAFLQKRPPVWQGR